MTLRLKIIPVDFRFSHAPHCNCLHSTHFRVCYSIELNKFEIIVIERIYEKDTKPTSINWFIAMYENITIYDIIMWSRIFDGKNDIGDVVLEEGN